MKKVLSVIFITLLAFGAKANTGASVDSTKNKQITQFNVGKMRVTIEEDADSLANDADTSDTVNKRGSVVIKMDDDSAHHSKYKVKNRTFFIPEYWGGLCIGTNGYMTASGSTKLPTGYEYLELNQGKSIAVALNFDGPRVNLYKKKLHLVTGLGFEWNNYRFSSDMTLNSDSNLVSAYSSGLNYRKNKLTASYIAAPLLLGFNTNPRSKKHFFVAGGIIGGLNLAAHSKQVFDLSGKTYKNKVEDDFNLEPFRYDATLRFGYRNFTIFANYSLSELFRPGRGPELHPFSFGIKLL